MATPTHLPPCYHGWTSLSCSKYKPSLSLVLRSLPLSISSRTPYGSRETFLPLISSSFLLGYYQRQTNLFHPLPLVGGTPELTFPSSCTHFTLHLYSKGLENTVYTCCFHIPSPILFWTLSTQAFLLSILQKQLLSRSTLWPPHVKSVANSASSYNL